MATRPAAVAGTWYPGGARALASAVEQYLSGAHDLAGELVALIAPHAGLMYSGPVAAHAYALLRDRRFDTVVIVGPSHFVGFSGVAVYPRGGFETPFGVAAIDEDVAQALLRVAPIVREHPAAHGREHSVEMQLPFVKHLLPDARIVPLVMGYQTAETSHALGDALGDVLDARHALIVASSDLSHYQPAHTAAALDAVVTECVARFDAEALQRALDARPDHACGGGPMVATLRAAKWLGAKNAVVLDYADSGDVSGDKSAVVGYMAAALGTFASADPRGRAT
ncbi:MAG TPA: AmmeMemoRadiSam system protein B [Vicinamibacterales bacterium]|nr:AmmeMemoRadiSam system protein B [Vicinamibacterales bacterium]